MKRIFHLSAFKRKGLWKVIPSGLISLAFGMLYLLLEHGIIGEFGYYPTTGNTYDFATQGLVILPASIFLGISVALVEGLVFDRLFINQPLFFKVIVKSVVYVLFIFTFLSVAAWIANAVSNGVSLFSSIVVEGMLTFFTSVAVIGLTLYVGAVIALILFVNEVFDYFGKRVTLAYLFGKYHTPKQEERIFMFMDLKSSTTIAEKLGHVKYFRWLNDYYRDITEHILASDGEIYQYVGDEVVISWEKKQGLDNERCLKCFFSIQEGLEKYYRNYMDKFGVFPRFKAGMHMGTITTGEIGMIKKEIIYTGDVLNTAARLESNCNRYQRDFLVSGDIKEGIGESKSFLFESLGRIYLKGKIKPLELYSVRWRDRP